MIVLQYDDFMKEMNTILVFLERSYVVPHSFKVHN